MPYSTSAPPRLIAGGLTGGNTWYYTSTDAATAVRVSGYFTNGYDLGMRVGDIVFMVDSDASPTAAQIFVVNAASPTAVDVSDGVAITATDTD